MDANIVKIGERRVFRSTLQGEDDKGILVRLYTGQQVDVIADLGPTENAETGDMDGEHLFTVRADDGIEFAAWETELIPHATSHYVTPDGEYVHDPEFRFDEEA